MLAAADDEVIVQRDPDGFRRFAHLLGHLDIGARRRNIAAWMIVNHDYRAGIQFERALHHFAGIDGRRVDRPLVLLLVSDKRVLAIEEEEMKFLAAAKPIFAVQ